MSSTPPDTHLEWLRSHKAKIGEQTKSFFRYVVDTENPLRTPKVEDSPSPEISVDWRDDDEKRVLLLACILAHQSCGRPMSLGILNRIIQHQTDFASGVEPLSMVQDMVESKLVIIEGDSNEIFRLDSPMLGHYIKLTNEAFGILTGLRFQSDSDEIIFSDHPNPAKDLSIPEHLLKLGMLLRQKAKEQMTWSGRSSFSTDTDRQQKSIDSAASGIAGMINEKEILRDWIGPRDVDPVDVQVLATLFTKRVSEDRTYGSDIPSTIGETLAAKIDVARRLRTGMLRESEVITVTRMGAFELGDEVFDHLLELNGSTDKAHEDPPSPLFANRFKSGSTFRENDDSDPEDPFAGVSEN